MIIEKKTTISPMTTDGEVICPGDTVIFNADGRCHAGVYVEITKRGAMKFKGKIAGTDVTFNVMPNSIKEIYKADVKVNSFFPLNPPVVESEV